MSDSPSPVRASAQEQAEQIVNEQTYVPTVDRIAAAILAAEARQQAEQVLDRLQRILEIERGYLERLAICPDHRGKHDGTCIVCQAEKRTADDYRERVAALTQALKAIDGMNSHFGPGPHCTCSQREREDIVRAALTGAQETTDAGS